MAKSATVDSPPISDFDEMLVRIQSSRTSLTRAIMCLRSADPSQWPRLIVAIIVALLRLHRTNCAAMALLEVPDLATLLGTGFYSIDSGATGSASGEGPHRPMPSEDKFETSDKVAAMEGKDSWKL